MENKENRFSFMMPKELNMYYCGKKSGCTGHRYGPALRDHFLFLYVENGEGVIAWEKKSRSFSSKDIVVMFPGEKIYCEVTDSRSISIFWLGVYGGLVYDYLQALNITRDNPVCRVPEPLETEAVFDDIFSKSQQDSLSAKIECISLIHKFFSLMSAKTKIKKTSKDYIAEAKIFMKYHYEQDITVADVAQSLNLEKNYFTKLFKDSTGVTPIKWITDLRIKKACALLSSSDLSIKEVAYSVGISDPLYFSRMFNKNVGMPPKQYRAINS